MVTILGTDISRLNRPYIRYLEFEELKKDPTSIIYYTNAFDNFLLSGVLPDSLKVKFPDIYSDIDNVWLQNLARKYNEIDHPWVYEIVDLIVYYRKLFWTDINYLNKGIANAYVYLQSYMPTTVEQNCGNIVLNFIYYMVAFTQLFANMHNDLFSYLKTDNNLNTFWFTETVYYFDFFLILFEIVVIFFLLIHCKGLYRIKSISNKFYDDIVSFFKLNGLSYVEITSVVTIFFFFIIGDIILSFGEDCYFDNLFFGIIVFLVLCLFLLLVSLDVKYFYSMNSVSSNSMNARTLIFDIFNNFISLLRIFLCWVRYIIYDIQVDLIDLSYFYLDYNGDIAYLLLTNTVNSSTGNTAGILACLYSSFSILIIFLLDIFFIIAQIVICVFKLFIAFYILWLILDLFFFKILNHKELKRV